MVRTSKIHIALIRTDKRIEKEVSCPVPADTVSGASWVGKIYSCGEAKINEIIMDFIEENNSLV